MDTVRSEFSRHVLREIDRVRALSDDSISAVEITSTPRRGGKRAGAGRKKSGRRVGAPHRRRPELSSKHPVHVTMKMDRRRPGLRNRHIYRKVHRVLRGFLGRDDFRVVHISIQDTHLHLLVEAANRNTLTRSMQSLAIRFQRAINGEVGRLFVERYHSVQIKTARQARCALAYVLNNWRRHRLDIDDRGRMVAAKLDEFSSALTFRGWRGTTFATPTGYEVLPVSAPTTWLLRVGWAEYGRIDPYETPGPLR